MTLVFLALKSFAGTSTSWTNTFQLTVSCEAGDLTAWQLGFSNDFLHKGLILNYLSVSTEDLTSLITDYPGTP